MAAEKPVNFWKCPCKDRIQDEQFSLRCGWFAGHRGPHAWGPWRWDIDRVIWRVMAPTRAVWVNPRNVLTDADAWTIRGAREWGHTRTLAGGRPRICRVCRSTALIFDGASWFCDD